MVNIGIYYILHPFLTKQTLDIKKLIKRLRPNKKKDLSISSIRYGNGLPEHSRDFEMLNQKMRNLLENLYSKIIAKELIINRRYPTLLMRR